MPDTETLKRTPLHAVHEDLGARLMPFGGYEMPVQYGGIIEEHMAVRERAGLFDVSHMGEVFARGPHATEFVQRLVTNDASALYDGKAMYTVMCKPDGGIVDDLIVYRLAEDEYMLVINAANIPKDIAWMREQNEAGADLDNASDRTALLALQGPRAFKIAQTLTDEPLDDLKFYHFSEREDGAFLDSEWAVISRTGYTGEPGLELYLPAGRAADCWQAVMDAGRDTGLEPAGLGARDTLRLEAGLCLYGNDITEETNPYEANLGWLVKLDAGDFVGRDALRNMTAPARKLIAFVVEEERGIPRQGHALLDENGSEIGTVTSGSQSPVLERGVGMGYVPNEERLTEPGSTVQVSGRRTLRATVRKPPLHE
jgi:aminomethyltransferase